jgi:hypothetical protein
VVGAVAALFATPMLWALGAFGTEPQAIRSAVVFAASAVWFFFVLGYGAGWAMRGFVIRQKDEDDAPAHRPAAPAAPHPAPHRPAGH